MSRTIRWGFWGTGAVAHHLAADMPLVADATLYAVASRTRANAERFATRFGAVHSYDRLDDLLNDEAVDVVYIATPHTLHVRDCLSCIAAGKAVLCEKPFTLNAKQAAQVAAAARQASVFCMEAMWTRFIPAIKEVKSLIDAGELGTVRMLSANFAYPEFYDSGSRLFSREAGGGALLDRGVYTLSLARYLLGKPQSIVGSASIGVSGVDDQSAYQLGYENGALADLSASLRVRGTNEAVIMGEAGQICLHDPFYRAHRYTRHSFSPPAPPESMNHGHKAATGLKGTLKRSLRQNPAAQQLRRRLDRVAGAFGPGNVMHAFPGNGYQFELAEVTRCLQMGLRESPVMPLDETVEIMQMADALRSHWGLDYPGE